MGEGGYDVWEVLERARGDIGNLAPSVANVDDDSAARGVQDARLPTPTHRAS